MIEMPEKRKKYDLAFVRGSRSRCAGLERKRGSVWELGVGGLIVMGG